MCYNPTTPLMIQPQVLILQPGLAECAKLLKSAAPRMGVLGVLDSSKGALQLLKFKMLINKKQKR